MITYLIEAAIVHLLLYGIYILFLQSETHNSFKRFYLIGSIVVSITVPFISIPLPSLADPLINQAQQMVLMEEVIVDAVGQSYIPTDNSILARIPYLKIYSLISGILFFERTQLSLLTIWIRLPASPA